MHTKSRYAGRGKAVRQMMWIPVFVDSIFSIWNKNLQGWFIFDKTRWIYFPFILFPPSSFFSLRNPHFSNSPHCREFSILVIILSGRFPGYSNLACYAMMNRESILQFHALCFKCKSGALVFECGAHFVYDSVLRGLSETICRSPSQWFNIPKTIFPFKCAA